MNISFKNIAKALKVKPTRPSKAQITTLLTDSRSLYNPEGTLFFALRMPTRNGLAFVNFLYHRGVRHFVVEELPKVADMMRDASFLVVPDTLKALQTVGALCRQPNMEIVAVAGSRGKTIVKEWLYEIMADVRRVARSPRSYNSQIGVPLSMAEINENDNLAIIEAGISRTGEMEILSDIIRPTSVIFTCLASDHAEGFSSEMEKAREKVKIAMGNEVHTVVYPADDFTLSQAVRENIRGKNLVSWSQRDPSATIYVDDIFHENEVTFLSFYYKDTQYEVGVPLTDSHDIEDAIAVLSWLMAEGIDFGVISRGMKHLHPVDLRLNVTDGVNNTSIIYDAFTPDFTSLLPAIDFMRRRNTSLRPCTIILSDLNVTRHQNPKEIYQKLLDSLNCAEVHGLIGIGKEISEHIKDYRKRSEDFLHTPRLFDSVPDFLENMSTSDFERDMILIKGPRSLGFEEIAEMLEARTHETVLEVNLDSLAHNFNYFKRQIPEATGVVAMVKASAYGAGSLEVARTMEQQGAAYLAVAVLDEGIELRSKGVKMPIMVMNPKVMNYRAMFYHKLEPEIYTLDILRDVIREAAKNGVKDYPVHIKLDTGMHRMGFTPDEIPQLISLLKAHDEVRPSTLFSHLATADCPDMDDYTQRQLQTFEKMTRTIMAAFPFPIKRHILNSAGILRFPQYHYDLVRLGIGLYGVNTLPPEMEEPLETVSALRTVIISIRELEAGETVGYGRKGVLRRRSRIAIIPVGYADGMNRHFGCGAINVKVNGREVPTVGNICMDACMIDVTDIDCEVGDRVEIFGPEMPVERLSNLLDTIPYEILTSVSPRVKRVYYRE